MKIGTLVKHEGLCEDIGVVVFLLGPKYTVSKGLLFFICKIIISPIKNNAVTSVPTLLIYSTFTLLLPFKLLTSFVQIRSY